MSKLVLVLLLLAPFVAWDSTLYLLRRQGEQSPQYQRQVREYFSTEEIATGREHVLRHNVLFPSYRVIFYAFFGLLLFLGLGARLEAALLPWVGGRWYLALPLFILILLTARLLLHLPLSAYAEFGIERELGLSTITPGLWLADRLKSLALSWLFACLVALPVLGLIRAMPRLWPLAAAAVVIALTAVSIWISPWLIAPLFNRFTRIEGELAGQVELLADRAGMPLHQVYQMDASRRSKYPNAYFTGLGNSRRVVLYDTLVETMDRDEVLVVVAHELAHWKLGHVRLSFLLEAAGVTVGLWLFWGLLQLPALRQFFGVPGPASLVVLVLLPFLIALAGTVTAPLAAAVSRRFERQADRMSLRLTEDPPAFIDVQKKLVRQSQSDLLQPRLIHLFYGTHPRAVERIEMAERFSRREAAD